MIATEFNKEEFPIATFLKKVVSDSLLHQKWLNMLSYLEYIGARKIIKSQNADQLDLNMLEHIAEEARHALFFKRLLINLYPQSDLRFGPNDILAGSEADIYFQKLDRWVEDQIEPMEPKTLNYAYVTWLIEERAMSVYQPYSEILKSHFDISLRGLIQEEKGHLAFIEKYLSAYDPNFKYRKVLFMEKEEELFARLFGAMVSELTRDKRGEQTVC